MLAGPRLRIRPFEESDITETYLGWLNDADVVRFSNQRFRRHSQETSHAYLRGFHGTENCFLLIVSGESGVPLGTMTVYRSLPHGTADVGIMIGAREAWGLGYGQEAWNLVLSWLLDTVGVRKVTAGTLATNIGMLRLIERSGMSHEATRYAQEIVEGAPVDVLYYARFQSS